MGIAKLNGWGKITNILKKILSLVLCSMFLCAFAFSQTTQEPQEQSQTENTSTATYNALEPENSSTRPYGPSSEVALNTQQNATQKTPSPVWQFV